jgi:hypothetical protein
MIVECVLVVYVRIILKWILKEQSDSEACGVLDNDNHLWALVSTRMKLHVS